jgi:hypothetical protein
MSIFSKAIKETAEAAAPKMDAAVEKGMSKFTDKLIKASLVGAGAVTVGGGGYLAGRLHGARKFNTALTSFNNAENEAIADQYYNQGLGDKTASLLKNKVARVILAGSVLGGTGYAGGRLHQNLKNQELANAFNAYNQEENKHIAQTAYEYGKTASIIGDTLDSFSAIPKFIKWRRVGAQAAAKKIPLQNIRGTSRYSDLNGSVKERHYDRLIGLSEKKSKEYYDKTRLALGTIASAASATGGFGIGKLVPEKHKEKIKGALQYAAQNQPKQYQ